MVLLLKNVHIHWKKSEFLQWFMFVSWFVQVSIELFFILAYVPEDKWQYCVYSEVAKHTV